MSAITIVCAGVVFLVFAEKRWGRAPVPAMARRRAPRTGA